MNSEMRVMEAIREKVEAGQRLTFDDGHHKMAVALWLFGAVKDVFAMIDATDSIAGPLDAPASVVWRHREGNVHGIWDIIYAPKFKVPSDYYTLDECFEITGETGTIHVTRATGRREEGAPLVVFRDGQLASLLKLDLPADQVTKLRSILHYNGLPMDAQSVTSELVTREDL